MSNPTVACICLTKDRPEMLKRAVASFRAQAYERKRLLVFNTGPIVGVHDLPLVAEIGFGRTNMTIGALRNEANSLIGNNEIIAHLDDDDYSHPNRLTEQVSLLQASGADVVGYNSLLFWDTRECPECAGGRGNILPFCPICDLRYDPSREVPVKLNRAWLYRAINPRHILGTSFMYRRETWQRQPFDDIATGEDTRFAAKLKVAGVSSMPGYDSHIKCQVDGEPRMIASVHGDNSSGYAPEKDRTSTRRVPEFDDVCRRMMQL